MKSVPAENVYRIRIREEIREIGGGGDTYTCICPWGTFK
jgi:hypothetical protein